MSERVPLLIFCAVPAVPAHCVSCWNMETTSMKAKTGAIYFTENIVREDRFQ